MLYKVRMGADHSTMFLIPDFNMGKATNNNTNVLLGEVKSADTPSVADKNNKYLCSFFKK